MIPKREYSDYNAQVSMPDEEYALYQAARHFSEAAEAWEDRFESGSSPGSLDVDQAAKALRHAAHVYHTRIAHRRT